MFVKALRGFITGILALLAAVLMGENVAAASAAEPLFSSPLPTVQITCDTKLNALGTVQYSDISLELTGDGYQETELYSGSAGIRIRGNSTAGLDKKPFKLKLKTGTDLLGMGKSKHWVLLANAIDPTCLRNMMMQTLAGDLGMDRMQSRLVNLYYNGTYMGIYELSEQVRIGKTRVDIYDWSDLAKELAESIAGEYLAEGAFPEDRYEELRDSLEREFTRDYSWVSAEDHIYYCTTFKYKLDDRKINCEIDLSEYVDFDTIPKPTGGALLEMDFYANSTADLKTAYLLPIYLSSPDYTSEHFTALEEYMKEYVQVLEYALHSTDFIFRNADDHYATSQVGAFDWRKQKWTGSKYEKMNFRAPDYEGMHYSELLDMDSAIANFIVCEIADNWDSMKNSFFMYKDMDSKLVFGPAWDFDWAFGNSMYGIDTAGASGSGENKTFRYATKWQTTNNWFTNEQYYQTQQFNRLLIRDPYFIVRLYEKYQEVKDTVIDTFYDTYAATIEANREELAKNSAKWKGHVGAVLAGDSLDSSEKNTLRFIDQRIRWLDDQFSSIEKLMGSLGGYDPNFKLSLTEVDTDSEEGYTVITANIRDRNAASLSFQVNGRFIYTAPVNDESCTVRIPDEAVAADAGHLCVVVIRALGSDGKYIENLSGTEKGVYTNAESNYVTFSKEVTLPGVTEGQGSGGSADNGLGDADGFLDTNDSNLETEGKKDPTQLSVTDYLTVLIPCVLVFVIVGGAMLLTGKKKQTKKVKALEDKDQKNKDDRDEERQD